jgi:hypothetical protein
VAPVERVRHAIEGEFLIVPSHDALADIGDARTFSDESDALAFLRGVVGEGDGNLRLGDLFYRADVGAAREFTGSEALSALALQLATGNIRVVRMAAAGARTKVLPVPYFVQPTSNTCQSTCLKMIATYLEAVMEQSTGAAARNIPDIWKDINESDERPVKVRNAHANMKWWLERHFPSVPFEYHTITDEALALEKIIEFIDAGMPVLVSVSHADVEGHIILVVGYENYVPLVSSPDSYIVVHDPYGRFDPSLLSRTFGKKRWDHGMSLKSGGESGPGEKCRVPITSVSRRRAGDKVLGTYYLLSGRR